MKKFLIEESEKERILEMHKKATMRQYLSKDNGREWSVNMLQEQKETDYSTDINLKTQMFNLVNANKVKANTPFVIGQFIFNPISVEVAPYRIQGWAQTFITNNGDVATGIPMLYPANNGGGYSTFQFEKAYTAKDSNLQFKFEYPDVLSDGKQVGKLANDAINTHLLLDVVRSSYDANPNKNAFDATIGKLRKQVAEPTVTSSNTVGKNFSAALTGNAKTFYNLNPGNSLQTTQTTPK
jgi:hypothetical protein